MGPGGIGRVHIDALRRIGVDVVAVAASSEIRGRELASELRVPVACGSAAELVAHDQVDVVHICSPTALHPEHVRQALAAGKHVVCEKPLTQSASEGLSLLRDAESRGVMHAVAYNYRFYPVVQAMRATVRAGRLGRVHLIRGSYLLDELLVLTDSGSWLLDPERRGSSLSLADVGVHWWDLVEHVSGQRVREVAGTRQAVRAPDVVGEDSAAIMLKLDGGATAVAAISGAAPGHSNTIELELIGTEGSAWWEQEDPDRLWFGGIGEPVQLMMRPANPAGVEAPGTLQLPAGHVEGYLDAFRDLLATVYKGIGGEGGAAFPTFEDGARGARVLEALVQSADRGEWVTVPE